MTFFFHMGRNFLLSYYQSLASQALMFFYIIMIVVDGTGLLPDLDKKILEVGLTLESLCGKIGA